MDHKTCGSVVVVPATAATAPHSQSLDLAHHHDLHIVVAHLVLWCCRGFVLALATYMFAATAWRAHRDPQDLGFVCGAYAALAGLLLCLRRAERLTPDSPAAERRRLHLAVWALSAALSCGFAYRVSLLLPAALAVVIWCMTSFVVLFGFYMLVLCSEHQQHLSGADEVDCDAEPLGKKIRPPSNEIV